MEEIISFFSGLGARGNYQEALWNIISEEAEAYFEGRSDLDKAESLIQNRVRLYLDELGE